MTARVRFLPSVARAIREKQYHASQQLSPEPDGSVIAEFRLTSVVELKSWLLSWGANVLVLEPASLAEEMRREAEKVMALYERKSPAARTTREPRHPSTKRSKPRRPR